MTDDLLGKVLETVPLAMVLVAPDALIWQTNAPARTLLGDGLEGRHYMTAIRQPDLVGLIDGVLAGGPGGKARYLVTGPGRDVVYRSTVASLGPQGASIAFEDITEIEQAEEMRRDFVANVSHELRTPLTALVGFIETLRGAARDDPAARQRFLSIMDREAARMNRLVGDLLSLSRVESQERMRPSDRVDVVALVRQTVATLRGLCETSGIVVTINAPTAPVTVAGDADQLTQVLHNLIENAVKYGGSGGRLQIDVTRDASSLAMRGPAVTIAVRDFGDGIAPIHIARLTERFYRADTHRSREMGGTGLGLAIVKHIVNRHRGRLRIESTVGEGSCFTVILPAI
jgi:two-component system phosphate regulon sensor histidine kinase PhoR